MKYKIFLDTVNWIKWSIYYWFQLHVLSQYIEELNFYS